MYLILSIVDPRLEVLDSVQRARLSPSALISPHRAQRCSPHREKANGVRANAMAMNPSKLLAQLMVRFSSAIKCKVSDLDAEVDISQTLFTGADAVNS